MEVAPQRLIPGSSPAPGRPAPSPHSPVSWGPAPAHAQPRGGSGGGAPECGRRGHAGPPQAHGGERRHSGPLPPRALLGAVTRRPPSRPRAVRPATQAPGPRPRLYGHTHRAAPRLRCAPRGPAGRAGRWRGESGGRGSGSGALQHARPGRDHRPPAPGVTWRPAPPTGTGAPLQAPPALAPPLPSGAGDSTLEWLRARPPGELPCGLLALPPSVGEALRASHPFSTRLLQRRSESELARLRLGTWHFTPLRVVRSLPDNKKGNPACRFYWLRPRTTRGRNAVHRAGGRKRLKPVSPYGASDGILDSRNLGGINVKL